LGQTQSGSMINETLAVGAAWLAMVLTAAIHV
jgi:hypothetical protein